MAENNAGDDVGTKAEAAPTPAASHLPQTQEDLDRIIEGRLARERKDLKALKDKADAYDALLEKDKSELQKAQEAEAAAKSELEKLQKSIELSDMRAKVSKDHGVPGELITGSTLDEMESSAKALKAFHESTHSAVVELEGIAASSSTGAEKDPWEASLKQSNIL